MEQQFDKPAGEPVSYTHDQTSASAAKCPFLSGANANTLAGTPSNAQWWPESTES